MKNPIYPCLWFDGKAKEAAEFYCSVFKDSKITTENPMVVTFASSGQKFMCLNGGPQFQMNPSASFFVVCETEAEIDAAWDILSKEGSILMALDKYEWSEKYGWVQDKYGVNWQLSFGKMTAVGQKFTPTLMFTENVHGKAEEAISFYTSVFKNSDIVGILRYTEDDHDVAGTVKHAQFRLNNNVFMAMDSGLAKGFGFNEALSFVVECENQQEIDYFWGKLTDGGEESRCGWLKDKYGVSWQIIPEILTELMNDSEKAPRVVQAFMQMKKFNIDTLLKA
ncbi:3-demethylubiquinone-9 3-methyltransferase [Flavobacterium saliperosum S13]|uniref:Glyoxalase superfamily enzyme, possibly 3-demethylubiquinone-9 3-methyltransferase n=2 Tax=Flavobacterium saliperosum TaxID=329186 RepID=A0A1G4V371_9FLAO|nr:VOC family protein [Flavobacterium saliperosum]ESU28587.1 3-demethylubiquinone-9 3-methyltransferase [Flavobacterium saliperosum S13]SCW99888.1 Glyoxalase superfamily enzyme, possibly 3-demethylubiquinone-9 3-methyltransferase [Flavobacterium saliperosum]